MVALIRLTPSLRQRPALLRWSVLPAHTLGGISQTIGIVYLMITSEGYRSALCNLLIHSQGGSTHNLLLLTLTSSSNQRIVKLRTRNLGLGGPISLKILHTIAEPIQLKKIQEAWLIHHHKMPPKLAHTPADIGCTLQGYRLQYDQLLRVVHWCMQIQNIQWCWVLHWWRVEVFPVQLGGTLLYYRNKK